ncbi:MAG: VOC family protein [Actinomycetota bacterium]|nr:VOC family protein [Actinomycetota bacterium]
MKITRVLHASVNAAEVLDATAAFYRDFLGLSACVRPDIPGVPGHWFAVGDVEVHLVGRPAAAVPIDPSRHHVCFGVADLDDATTALEAARVDYIRGEQRHPGRVVRQVFFTDPAGNTVELQEDSGE